MIEVLVVFAIGGVLVGLLGPALQRGREQSRRLQCLNRLRQLGAATMEFEATHRTFPPTRTGFDGKSGRFWSSSPHVSLLPYLEFGDVATRFDLDEDGLDNLPNDDRPPTSRQNSMWMQFAVAVFVCPADMVPAGANSFRANFGAGPELMYGPDAVTETGGKKTGAFVNGRALSAAHFHDGLSHTVFYSERSIGDQDPQSYDAFRDAYFCFGRSVVSLASLEVSAECPPIPAQNSQFPQHDSFLGTTWVLGGMRQTYYNHAFGPNSPRPDRYSFGVLGGGNGAISARSWHVGGVNIVLGDGSARFTSNEIALPVWQALATSSGRDFVD